MLRSAGIVALLVVSAVVCDAADDKDAPDKKQRVSVSFYPDEKTRPDIFITFPGQTTPSIRALIPEALRGCAGTFIHVIPAKWETNAEGTMLGAVPLPVGELKLTVKPQDCFVDVSLELHNKTDKALDDVIADFCFGVTAGGGHWANKDFVPESKLVRVDDGKYWFERAQKRTYVRRGGKWCSYFAPDHDDTKVDASVIVVANEAENRFAFLMWDKPLWTKEWAGAATSKWVNHANACMHLHPLLAATVPPGGKASMSGRIGISTQGLDHIWKLYEELTKK